MRVEEARGLMQEWVSGPALRVHMEAVAACMKGYAARLDAANADRWAIAGLLHDFDYEKHPTLDLNNVQAGHPFVGVRELERRGVDEEIRTAILGHAQYSGVARTTPMAITLFAVDELAGFIVACCRVRPNGIGDLEPRSVKKKLKDKAFAAGVNREDIAAGVSELAALFKKEAAAFEGEHIQACIDAIRGERERLGV